MSNGNFFVNFWIETFACRDLSALKHHSEAVANKLHISTIEGILF